MKALIATLILGMATAGLAQTQGNAIIGAAPSAPSFPQGELTQGIPQAQTALPTVQPLDDDPLSMNETLDTISYLLEALQLQREIITDANYHMITRNYNEAIVAYAGALTKPALDFTDARAKANKVLAEELAMLMIRVGETK